MAESQQQEYKGYTMSIAPQGEKCAVFDLTIRKPTGEEWQHVGTAGDTAEAAFDRGKQMIDHEEAMQAG